MLFWNKIKDKLKLLKESKQNFSMNKRFNFQRFYSPKFIGGLLLISYFGSAYLIMLSNEKYRFRIAATRMLSKITGLISDIPIPISLRESLYSKFIKKYGVNVSEIELPINEYKTFKEFFTRKLKIHSREIENSVSIDTICSPSDGTVLSFGSSNYEIDCIKGIKYSVMQLITGFKTTNELIEDKQPEMKIPKKISYIIIYLSPSNYHRFHSPTDFVAEERRHIRGTLFPVMTSYLEKRNGVFIENERVSINGKWTKGFMSLIFVGAFNVGSIILHFDEQLRTNDSNLSPRRISCFSYRDEYKNSLEYSKQLNLNSLNILKNLAGQSQKELKEFDINDISNLEECKRRIEIKNAEFIKNNIDKEVGDPVNNLELKEKLNYLENLNYIYSKEDEKLLTSSLINNFSDFFLKNKLEKLEKDNSSNYLYTKDGIDLKKGQEIGMFSLGSTIVIIFENNGNGSFKVKPGDKVKFGQEIFG